MRPLAMTAVTVTSAMGYGLDATLSALRARRTGLRPCNLEDVSLGGYIGRVDGVERYQLPSELGDFDCRNNRLAHMAVVADDFPEAVARTVKQYGAERVAIVLGTSTSGILAAEQAYRRRTPAGALPPDFDHAHTQDLFSLTRMVRSVLKLRGPALTISTACASSTKSFLEAAHLIESGVCDAAVVGGADSLCGTTLHGFAALELIAPGACRPCDAARDGISIGEAAGFALLERDDRSSGREPMAVLLGGGATSDGYHMSTPDPSGIGAAVAMRQALDSACLAPADIDYINLHGTGTRSNDAMEDVAVAAVFGTATPCSSTKGWSGHTLGAAGILEAVIATLSIRYGILPGCLGVTQVDPSFTSRVVTENQPGAVRRVLSNSFGFGGINCSLVFGAADGAPA